MPLSGHRRRLLLGVLAFAVVVGAFWPATRGEFVDFDDTENFVENPHYRGLDAARLRWMLTSFHMGHYQPVSWISLGLDQVWGRAVFGFPAEAADPRPHHVTNVLLHGFNAVVVYALGLVLLGDRRDRAVDAAALAAALLFGLHPLRVESVAWATERRDVLSSALLLLSVLLYLTGHAPSARGRTWRLTGAVLAYVLSLLARPIGIAMPILLLALDAWPLRRWGGARGWAPARGVWLEKLVFLVPALAAAAVAPLAQRAAGAAQALSAHGLVERVAVGAYGLGFYVWKSILPLSLSPIYEIPYRLDASSPKYVVSAVAVTAGIALVAIAARRQPALGVAAMCYVLPLLPVLGLFQSGNQEVADRYSYLPGAILALLASALLLRAWTAAATGARRAAHGIAIAIVLVVLAVLARRQLVVWQDTRTLWAHAVRVQPQSSMAQNGHGFVLFERGDHAGAEAHFQRAIELNPLNDRAHRNRWAVESRRGGAPALDAAYRVTIERIETALRTELGRHPTGTRLGSRLLADARANLGLLLLGEGDVAQAREQFRLALEQVPDCVPALAGEGVALLQRGDIDAAVTVLRRAVDRAPGATLNRYNLAVALVRQGRTDEAITQSRLILEHEPGHDGARRLLQHLAP